MRNYHPAFMEGTNNVRASSFKDHAVTDIHTRFVWVLGELAGQIFKLDRTNLALYWQFDSTSEKVISSPGYVPSP